ncbi:hypothetical protein [Photorhabdus heterorhabditis]|uniref:Uncharacterized protein n=1 Tax=Photorhabdus heterorhabditis TaxID=880156 RepID=A0A5B0WYH4_9GAMM|nr:hypothetical protein [Photorhabdus heterorhabditis]KAA1192132.1 hypothetical protein F0L16_08655 [Photorhabdus heterorhabditis]
MLLYSRGNNTLRLLERHYGSELRYNRQVFFANDDLTRIIKLVIDMSKADALPGCIAEPGIDEKTIRDTLNKLSAAGIPLSFWGALWHEGDATFDDNNTEKE